MKDEIKELKDKNKNLLGELQMIENQCDERKLLCESATAKPRSLFSLCFIAIINTIICYPFANSIAENLADPHTLLIYQYSVDSISLRPIILLIAWCLNVRIIYALNSCYEVSFLASLLPIFFYMVTCQGLLQYFYDIFQYIRSKRGAKFPIVGINSLKYHHSNNEN